MLILRPYWSIKQGVYWGMHDWQSIAALFVIGLVIATFGFRLVRKLFARTPQTNGCGGSCECILKPKVSQGGPVRTKIKN